MWSYLSELIDHFPYREYLGQNITYYLTYCVIGTTFYFLWGNRKYFCNPQEILFMIFDKGTNVYTYSRLCTTDYWQKIPVLWDRDELRSGITKVLCISSNNKVLDLSESLIDEKKNAEKSNDRLIHFEKLNKLRWEDIIDTHNSEEAHVTETSGGKNDVRIEIHYILGEREYIAIVPHSQEIHFKAFQIKDLKGKVSNLDDWEELEVEGTQLSEHDEEKLWKALEKYSGPLGDFYKNLQNICIKGEWFMDHSKEQPSPILEKGKRIVLRDLLGEEIRI